MALRSQTLALNEMIWLSVGMNTLLSLNAVGELIGACALKLPRRA